MPHPLILSTWSFGQRANRAAWPILSSGGSALDAVEAAGRDAESDPDNHTVGAGGYPDASGRVSLDACVMLSPRRRGGVCFVRSHEMVITLARRVMEQTPHVLLAGEGAEEFAWSLGLEESDLLSDLMRQRHEQWRAQRSEKPRLANIEERTMGLREPSMPGITKIDPEQAHDTIGILAIDGVGTLAGGCTTSGLPWKLPGRVGDSPIIGHGLYVDPRHGAAVCTGRGEHVMAICGAFLAVECLRAGRSPADAAFAVIERMRDELDLTDDDQVGVITVRPDGMWSSAALRPGFRVAARSEHQDELIEAQRVLYPAS
ncbi:MAG: N(4)-(beta-N-acetylglucosaminyl)-L-asparaginase [Candidatus Brachytrichaceae bacterium NZ_4S206]|jgi:isoaspartyl peptidase/L-asparaginase-like protein (Ntn-hydrolase superfamily)